MNMMDAQNRLNKRTLMNKNSKIYIAGCRDLMDLVLVCRFDGDGYTSLVYHTHIELDLTNHIK